MCDNRQPTIDNRQLTIDNRQPTLTGLLSSQGLKGVVDHLLCILPCEPATCRAAGLAASFVGHPALEDWHAASECSFAAHVRGGSFNRLLTVACRVQSCWTALYASEEEKKKNGV